MKKLCFGIITTITLITLSLLLAAGCEDTPYEGPGKGADRLPPLTDGPDAAVLRQKSEFELALDEVAAARREVKISENDGKTVTHTLNESTGATTAVPEKEQEPCYVDYWWTSINFNSTLTTAVNEVRSKTDFKELVKMGITDRHMPDKFAVPVREAIKEFKSTWKKGTVNR